MTAQVETSLPGVSRAIEGLDVDGLRRAIQEEYTLVAAEPERGFHFHTGRRLAAILAYDDEWLDDVPEPTIASFAGTGNPFSLGTLTAGEHVVDVGCGAGIDSIIAAKMVGPTGRVIGVDMTPEMVLKAREGAAQVELHNVEFRRGLAESLPVATGWADVVISNGVVNLFPDKLAGLQEMARVLKPGGRLQIGDILVQRAVPDNGKRDINLWKA
jgi:arsenite methyltransferase